MSEVVSVAEVKKVPAKPLYTVLPDGRWDFYVDNSSLKDFRLCEQFYKYRHIDKIAPRGGPPKLSMHVGSWWSDTLEHCYMHIKERGGISVDETMSYATRAWAKLNMESMNATKEYAKFGGWPAAVLMISQFYDRYLQEDARRWKIIAAESGFGLKGEILVGENSRVVVHWVGKPDLLQSEYHHLTPLDHKTVTRIDSDINAKYKPFPQLIGYAFATEVLARQLGMDVTVDRCIVNVCARTEPSDKPRDGKIKPRFIRVVVGYSVSEILEWRKQTLAKVSRLRDAIESGTFLWNEHACHNMYYRPCDYRGLCSVGEGARPDIIRGNFTQIERWVPYEVNEEE